MLDNLEIKLEKPLKHLPFLFLDMLLKQTVDTSEIRGLIHLKLVLKLFVVLKNLLSDLFIDDWLELIDLALFIEFISLVEKNISICT